MSRWRKLSPVADRLLGFGPIPADAVVSEHPYRIGLMRSREGGAAVSRIVIADGRDILRRGLRDLLGSHPGWDIVAEAEDGYSAVSAALQTAPDIIVIDSLLPGMNGLESASRIRQRVPRTEICFFSDCRE